MNLGDGLLFELENGKPKLILLSHGVEKSHTRPLFRPRAANILSSRQPSCLEELQVEEPPSWQQTGRRKEAQIKTVVPAARERSSILTPSSSKTCDNHNGRIIKAVTRVKSDRQKQSSAPGSSRSNKRSGKSQNTDMHIGGSVGPKDKLSTGDTGHKESVVVLTTEQLQKIVSSIQTSNQSQQSVEEKPQGLQSSLLNGGDEGGEMEEEERGGGEEMKKGDNGGGGNDSHETESRLSGCLFSWLEERQFDCRSTIKNKKAQWRKELDEQVALKQQQKRSAPDRSQFDENPRSVLSSHSSLNQREPPAAIRSSLKLGDITPVEEVLSTERREEQRRRWLEELDRQREETAERRRREKVLQSQAEDSDLWNTHFDSLQRRPPLHSTAPSALSAPSLAPSCMSERGEWEPSSSLSLVWEATSSCGAESVADVSVDMTSKYPSRASYLRTMTALLDPAQIEERERRRQKQLEQQRVIEAQVEERRRQKEQELARRRQEEEEEARRIALEREMLRRQYELDTTRESQKEEQSQLADQSGGNQSDDRVQETLESTVMRERQHLEEDVRSSDPPYKDTAVQTDAAAFSGIREESGHTAKVSAQLQSHAAPTNGKNAALKMGKENICQPGGGDPYEQFARTDRSKKDKKRPEWNTQKPSRRFVPASERYPATLQRNRLDSRLKRQAELKALQERTCTARTEPPAAPAPQHNHPRLCSSSTQARKEPNSKIENRQNSSSDSSSERHRLQRQQAADPLPPLVQEFVPFIRTDEVTLDPLEADANLSPQTHTDTDAPLPLPPPLRSESPPASSHPDSERQLCKTHTQRQQEILRGLAQLRKGLLQKQRELETDLNPMFKKP